MKFKILLFLVLVICSIGVSSATDISGYVDSYELTSGTYNLIGDVTANNTAFIINGSNINFEGHGYDVKFADIGAGYGFKTSTGIFTNITINNTNITQTNESTPSTSNHAFYLSGITSSTITHNNINVRDNYSSSFILHNTSNVVVTNNVFTSYGKTYSSATGGSTYASAYYGVYLNQSDYVTFNNNSLNITHGCIESTSQERGPETHNLMIECSDHSNLHNNTIRNPNVISYGIYFYQSTNTTLRNNKISAIQSYSIKIFEGTGDSDVLENKYDHDIDTTNLGYDDKPIYYYYNEDNIDIDFTGLEPSLIFVAYSDNVTLQNINMNNSEGIYFVKVTNSVVDGYKNIRTTKSIEEGITYQGVKIAKVYPIFLRKSNYNNLNNIIVELGGRHNYGANIQYSDYNNINNMTYNTSYIIPASGHNDFIDIQNSGYLNFTNLIGNHGTWSDYIFYWRHAHDIILKNVNIKGSSSDNEPNIAYADNFTLINVHINTTYENAHAFNIPSPYQTELARAYVYNSTFSGGIAGFINSGTTHFINSTYNSLSNSGTLHRQWYFNTNVTNSAGTKLSSANVIVTNVSGYEDFSETTTDGSITTQILTQYIQNATNLTYYTDYNITVSKNEYVTQTTQLNITSDTISNIILLTSITASDKIYVTEGIFNISTINSSINNATYLEQIASGWILKIPLYIHNGATVNIGSFVKMLNVAGIESFGILNLDNATIITSYINETPRDIVHASPLNSNGQATIETRGGDIVNSNVSYVKEIFFNQSSSNTISNLTMNNCYSFIRIVNSNNMSLSDIILNYGINDGISVSDSSDISITDITMDDIGDSTDPQYYDQHLVFSYGILTSDNNGNIYKNIIINNTGYSSVGVNDINSNYDNITIGYSGHVGFDIHSGHNTIASNITSHHSKTQNFLITSAYDYTLSNLISYNADGMLIGGDAGNNTGYNETHNITITGYESENDSIVINSQNMGNIKFYNITSTNTIAGIYTGYSASYGDTYVNNFKIFDSIFTGINTTDNDNGKHLQLYRGTVEFINVDTLQTVPTMKTRSYYGGNHSNSFYANLRSLDYDGTGLSNSKIIITANASDSLNMIMNGYGNSQSVFTTNSSGYTYTPCVNRDESIVLSKYFRYANPSADGNYMKYIEYTATTYGNDTGNFGTQLLMPIDGLTNEIQTVSEDGTVTHGYGLHKGTTTSIIPEYNWYMSNTNSFNVSTTNITLSESTNRQVSGLQVVVS